MQGAEPAAGVLYLVGTPIGNVGDLSPRARHVLGAVDRIACEDTRRSGLLLHNLGLRSREQGPRLLSFHEHNQASRIPELLEALASGEAIAVISDAGPAVTRLAEKLNAPVVNTLLGKGAVDETHPLHLGMLGMHGTAYANKAIIGCDLIMAIGARWDDRITGKLDEF